MPLHSLPRLFGHVLKQLRDLGSSSRHLVFVWLSGLRSEIHRLRFRPVLFLFVITLMAGSGLVQIMQRVQMLEIRGQIDLGITFGRESDPYSIIMSARSPRCHVGLWQKLREL